MKSVKVEPEIWKLPVVVDGVTNASAMSVSVLSEASP